jgi:hypothetical protein
MYVCMCVYVCMYAYMYYMCMYLYVYVCMYVPFRSVVSVPVFLSACNVNITGLIVQKVSMSSPISLLGKLLVQKVVTTRHHGCK